MGIQRRNRGNFCLAHDCVKSVGLRRGGPRKRLYERANNKKKEIRRERPHHGTRLYNCGRGDNGLDRDYSGNGDRHDTDIAVDLGLRAVAGDVASLTAAVARLAGCVEGAAVGGSAVTRDVAWERVSSGRHRGVAAHTELAASVALHGLSLAVAGKVVGASTLVAGGRARATSEATSEATEATARGGGAAAHGWARAVAGEMASHATAVAAAAGAGTAQAQSRAVSLDMSEALAVVALLGLKGSATEERPRAWATYSRWCGGGGTRWTRGQAACSCSKASRTTSTPLPVGQPRSCLRLAGSSPA